MPSDLRQQQPTPELVTNLIEMCQNFWNIPEESSIPEIMQLKLSILFKSLQMVHYVCEHSQPVREWILNNGLAHSLVELVRVCLAGGGSSTNSSANSIQQYKFNETESNTVLIWALNIFGFYQPNSGPPLPQSIIRPLFTLFVQQQQQHQPPILLRFLQIINEFGLERNVDLVFDNRTFWNDLLKQLRLHSSKVTMTNTMTITDSNRCIFDSCQIVENIVSFVCQSLSHDDRMRRKLFDQFGLMEALSDSIDPLIEQLQQQHQQPPPPPLHTSILIHHSLRSLISISRHMFYDDEPEIPQAMLIKYSRYYRNIWQLLTQLADENGDGNGHDGEDFAQLQFVCLDALATLAAVMELASSSTTSDDQPGGGVDYGQQPALFYENIFGKDLGQLELFVRLVVVETNRFDITVDDEAQAMSIILLALWTLLDFSEKRLPAPNPFVRIVSQTNPDLVRRLLNDEELKDLDNSDGELVQFFRAKVG